MDDLPVSFAAALRYCRAWETQQELADRCGLSVRSISSYEAGDLPGRRALEQLMGGMPRHSRKALTERWEREWRAKRSTVRP